MRVRCSHCGAVNNVRPGFTGQARCGKCEEVFQVGSSTSSRDYKGAARDYEKKLPLSARMREVDAAELKAETFSSTRKRKPISARHLFVATVIILSIFFLIMAYNFGSDGGVRFNEIRDRAISSFKGLNEAGGFVYALETDFKTSDGIGEDSVSNFFVKGVLKVAHGSIDEGYSEYEGPSGKTPMLFMRTFPGSRSQVKTVSIEEEFLFFASCDDVEWNLYNWKQIDGSFNAMFLWTKANEVLFQFGKGEYVGEKKVNGVDVEGIRIPYRERKDVEMKERKPTIQTGRTMEIWIIKESGELFSIGFRTTIADGPFSEEVKCEMKILEDRVPEGFEIVMPPAYLDRRE